MKAIIVSIKTCRTGLILLLISGLAFAFPAASQDKQDFSDSPLGRFISNNPEEFEQINAFVAGLGAFTDKLLQQAQKNGQPPPQDTYAVHSLKALMACKDMTELFAEATTTETSSATVFARYAISWGFCRNAILQLRPYYQNHETEFMALQTKIPPLMAIPKHLPYAQIQKLYSDQLDNKFGTFFSNSE